MTNHFKKDAETTKGNQKHALSTYNYYKDTIKFSRNETIVIKT